MTTENETVGWHHLLNGHEFEHTPGDSEGQESLVCCSPWAHKVSDTTARLNSSKGHMAAVRSHCKLQLETRPIHPLWSMRPQSQCSKNQGASRAGCFWGL